MHAGSALNGVALANPVPTGSPAMPRAAANAAPATRFTYIPVSSFLGTSHVHLERLADRLLGIGRVGARRGAFDDVRIPTLGGLSVALIRRSGRITERDTGQVAQPDCLNSRRIRVCHDRANTSRRITETNAGVPVDLGATDRPRDVLGLAIDGDLVANWGRCATAA